MHYYLLPPSEWKNPWWEVWESLRTFAFDLPEDIAGGATAKDLKCAGKRYEEGILLNQTIKTSPVLPAIQRYSWVMYSAIGHEHLSDQGQAYFNKHFLILSGMYGLLTPQDLIANYKLPITTELKNRRGTKITDTLLQILDPWDIVIDLLSWAYQKMIDMKRIEQVGIEVIAIEFFKKDGAKYTHGVKKVKGEQVRERCEEENFENKANEWIMKIIC